MCVVFPAGLYLMSDWIMVGYQNFWIVLLQLIVVLLIDDFYFYCFHRLLHKSDFLFKKIHKIHHRARNPFPSDYLYEHPLEWLDWTVGSFHRLFDYGWGFIYHHGSVLIIKVLHELDMSLRDENLHLNIDICRTNYLQVNTNEYHAMHTHKYQDVHFASVFSDLSGFWDRVFLEPIMCFAQMCLVAKSKGL